MDTGGNDQISERTHAWQGLFWPAVSVLGGMAVYFLLFGLLVEPLNPHRATLSANEYQFLWEAVPPPPRQEVLAADLNARYAIAIPTVMMALSFVAALFMAFRLVLPLFGWAAISCGVLSLPIGALVGYLEQHANTVRASVSNCPPPSGLLHCPLDQAVARAGVLGTFDAQSFGQVMMLVDINSMISVAAVFLLGMCFLFIARRATPDELTESVLRARKRAFLMTTIMGGLVLVFAVATTNGFYQLGPSMMAPEHAGAMKALAIAGSNYWGAVYTTVIVVLGAPAAFSVINDIGRGAQAALPEGSYSEHAAWRIRHGLAVNLRQTLMPVAAILSPLLTTPALTALSPALLGG